VVRTSILHRTDARSFNTRGLILLNQRLNAKPSTLAIALVSAAVLMALSGPSQASDRTVTGQQKSTAQQVAQKGVALSELAPGAPDVYTVKRGDTLWALSTMYLKGPWRWPELWGMNMDQVRNPHLIYPGQVLVLDKSSGRAKLNMAQGVSGSGDTVKLSPKVRPGEVNDAIASVSMALIAPFIQEMGVFNTDTLVGAPRIVAAADERVLMGRGEKAYVLGEVNNVRDWSVYRQATPLLDPTTKELLGYEARLIGGAELVRAGETRTVEGKPLIVPNTFNLTGIRSEVRAGDRLLPQPPNDLTTFVPHGPSKAIKGQIISVYGDGLIAGQNQIVSLNRGAADGVERGHVLSVMTDGRFVTDRGGEKPVTMKLPDERQGLLLVFRVFDRVSYALLLNAEQAIRAGDHFDTP
jgi:LysM repeat protein